MRYIAARKTFRAAAVPVTCAAASLLGLGSLALAHGAPTHAVRAAHSAPQSPAQIKSAGSYGLGVSMGTSLRRASMDATAISTQRLLQGLRDSLAGKATFDPAEQQAVRALIVSTRARIGKANHAAAHAFLARNGRKKGVVTTSSGLEYQVLKAGQGSPPTAGDTVTVNYRGTLLDGNEFDSSYKRGQPATLPVDRVIPGWQEALKMMKPGARWRIFVPPQLAYDLDSPPPIPPGSLLIFDVDLLQVRPPQPASQLQPRPPGQRQP
ncbi:MAG: FKBP-type peptidyl-prolyl cis-trans isomerase [Steroidobacteraceae bacterium]